jgi:hypothetical protein
MSEPMNLSPDQVANIAKSGEAPAGAIDRPSRGGGEPVNRRQGGRELAERLKARRAEVETPQAREAEPSRDVVTHRSGGPEKAPDAPEVDVPAEVETPDEVTSAPESDAGGDDAAQTAEEVALSRLQDLEEHYGIDIETLRGLTTTVKVNGEEVEVDLGKALDNYRLDAAITQKSQRLSAREREIEGEYQQTGQALQQQYQSARQQLQALHAQFGAELQSPQIAALKQSDPQSYLWWQDHLQTRQTQVAEQYKQLVAQEQQATQQFLAEKVNRARQRLLADVPDWGPEKQQKVMKVAQGFGFDDTEIRGMDDRSIKVALRIAELEEKVASYEKASAEANKKARRIVNHSTHRPGPRQSGNDSERREVRDKINAVKGQSGMQGRRAAAAALTASLKRARKQRK